MERSHYDSKKVWVYFTEGDYVCSMPDQLASQFATDHPEVIVFIAELITERRFEWPYQLE